MLVGFDMGNMMGRSLYCAISLQYTFRCRQYRRYSRGEGLTYRHVRRSVYSAISLRYTFRCRQYRRTVGVDVGMMMGRSLYCAISLRYTFGCRQYRLDGKARIGFEVLS